jgi:hypothetical protein
MNLENREKLLEMIIGTETAYPLARKSMIKTV